jgi:hypothetical protein
MSAAAELANEAASVGADLSPRSASSALAAALATAGVDWIVPDWPAPANVGALVTTRTGGVSTGPYATMNLGGRDDDDATALAENRRRFEAFLPGRPAWLHQVHGATVARLARSASPAPAADAAVTAERGVVCAILTADCLPVLFADRAGSAGSPRGCSKRRSPRCAISGQRPTPSTPGSVRPSVPRPSRSATTSAMRSARSTHAQPAASPRTAPASGTPTCMASPGNGWRGME